jgi:hypothetical protein
MSFVGGSISQAAAISGAEERLVAVEALAASKVATATFNAKVALLDGKDAEHDSRLGSVEAVAASKVAQAAYDAKVVLLDAKDVEHDAAIAVAVANDAAHAARLDGLDALVATKVAQTAYASKMSALDAKDAAHEGRLDAVEALAATKVAQADYDAKMAALDAKDAAHEGRLDAVEGRATALESDISGRVQAAIDEKVAQTVFDSLASELRSADSALTAALATKVAATTQAAVDEAQNGVIATKASIASVNSALQGLSNYVDSQVARLDGVDASKVAAVDYQAKVDALEEFIAVLLQTYTITKPTGGSYEYTGVKQNLLAPAFAPENPTNVSFSGNDLSFDLPETVGQISFVDVNVGGNWYQAWRSAVAPPNANVMSISGVRVTVTLPVAIAGVVDIFTRYDVFSGNADAGFYRLNA